MHLTREVREKLTRYVRPDQPFGPPDASDIKEPDCAAALFDWYNQAFADLVAGSDVLVGRRGSGKSALLGTFESKRYMQPDLIGEVGVTYRGEYRLSAKTLAALPDIVVEADTPSLVYEFTTMCERLSSVPPVELLARMWKVRIWRLVGATLRDRHPDLWGTLPDALRAFVDNDDLVSYAVTGVPSQHMLASDYVASMDSFLRRASKRCVVTFDNEEHYDFTDARNAILAGLVAATGKMIGAQPLSLDVKLCLPAENFEQFTRSVFRADKDLQRLQFLHWTTRELMHLAASRLKVYLQLYNEDEFAVVKDMRLTDRPTLRAFWKRYFPSTIHNALGLEEDSFTYLLRHTQLLPRQLLGILNAVALQALRSGRDPFSSPLLSSDIVNGVRDAEMANASAILRMYETSYPAVASIFDSVMPRLKRVFDYGYFERVYVSSAKRAMSEMGRHEFRHFWRLMLSTGAIGLLDRDGATSVYVTGMFEFNTKHVIRISDKDSLCVHPMFSRIYNIENDPPDRVVLPRGSEFFAESMATEEH